MVSFQNRGRIAGNPSFGVASGHTLDIHARDEAKGKALATKLGDSVTAHTIVS